MGGGGGQTRLIVARTNQIRVAQPGLLCVRSLRNAPELVARGLKLQRQAFQWLVCCFLAGTVVDKIRS